MDFFLKQRIWVKYYLYIMLRVKWNGILAIIVKWRRIKQNVFSHNSISIVIYKILLKEDHVMMHFVEMNVWERRTNFVIKEIWTHLKLFKLHVYTKYIFMYSFLLEATIHWSISISSISCIAIAWILLTKVSRHGYSWNTDHVMLNNQPIQNYWNTAYVMLNNTQSIYFRIYGKGTNIMFRSEFAVIYLVASHLIY